MVKLLLGRKDVRLGRPDNGGQTPLLQAARYGHDGAVKLLLDQEGISPDRPDNDGKTPLQWVPWYGYHGVRGLLEARTPAAPITV